ncbi:hypothetical protein COLO4_16483 [Corchorus olitorius]|uniref:Uncharacterized protein n=1 Tax=Corchorus olitorius TaxID=93759 RepID=A0A1R3JH59_9ROSI|nr:hypothetical protein COLO4_16483 [Corchorus olitorius]
MGKGKLERETEGDLSVISAMMTMNIRARMLLDVISKGCMRNTVPLCVRVALSLSSFVPRWMRSSIFKKLRPRRELMLKKEMKFCCKPFRKAA